MVKETEYEICQRRGHEANPLRGWYSNGIPGGKSWASCKWCSTEFANEVTSTVHERGAPIGQTLHIGGVQKRKMCACGLGHEQGECSWDYNPKTECLVKDCKNPTTHDQSMLCGVHDTDITEL